MPTVRTTMQPDREIEITDADYLDMQRQGILLADVVHTSAPASAAPAVPTKKTTAGAAGSKETDK